MKLLLPALLLVLLSFLFWPSIRETSAAPDATRNYQMTIDSIRDHRDQTWYPVVQIDTLFWFNENLAFVSPESDTIGILNGQQYTYVRVYSYADSKQVCPQGWRLPTAKEFDALVSTVFDTTFIGLATLPYNWQTISNNPGAYNFNPTGLIHRKKVRARESFNIWLEDTEEKPAYHVHMYDYGDKDNDESLSIFRHSHPKFNPIKNRKFAIRCVCDAKTLTLERNAHQ